MLGVSFACPSAMLRNSSRAPTLSLAAFFNEETEESDDKTRKYIEKLSRILQSKDFSELKKQHNSVKRPAISFAITYTTSQDLTKPNIFTEYARASRKLPPTPAKYKSMDALRAQSAEIRKTRETARPWRKHCSIKTVKPVDEVIYELREVTKLMWPEDSDNWELFREDNTKVNSSLFKRTIALMQTVVNLQNDKAVDKTRQQVLKDISTALYFC
jgi:hypothetical protein